jgi:uroporphyrinogen III methyltransferase/synthase
MGVARAADIASAMIASGRDPDTPAAAIERGTCSGQRVVSATLATLADALARERIVAPAVLVIGETVRVRDRLRTLHSLALDRTPQMV